MQYWEVIYEHVACGEIDRAVMVLFRYVNGLLCAGEFAVCDEFTQQADLEKLDTNLLVGLLSITHAAAEHLPGRFQVVEGVRERLQELAPDRVDMLMRGRSCSV
jgi:hypothetical protein